MGNIHTVGPNKALIVSGKKFDIFLTRLISNFLICLAVSAKRKTTCLNYFANTFKLKHQFHLSSWSGNCS